MTDQTENLVLEPLRLIRSDIADLRSDVSQVKIELTAIGQQMVGLTTAVYAGQDRMLTLERRVERIEHRLEIVD